MTIFVKNTKYKVKLCIRYVERRQTMSFFNKKYCDICNEKIGVLGNKKLDDGNMCKNCAKKLSPWFSDRRNTSLAEIKQQLDYREENKKEVAQFNITRRLGSNPLVLFDDQARRFMVTFDDDIVKSNPDVLEYSDVTACDMNIKETQTELMREDKDGKRVSYMIRRFEYSYDFNVSIYVNNPYFDEISFKLNTYQVDGNARSEYEQYKNMGEEICETLNPTRQTTQAGFAENATSAASKSVAFCPNCGKQVNIEGAKFCDYCGGKL
jgi:hypothetical protein